MTEEEYDELEELKKQKEAIEKREEYVADPTEWVEDKLKQIRSGIEKIPQKTTPVEKGNITMYTHLKNLEKRFDENPEEEKERYRTQLRERREEIEKRIEELEND